MTKYSRSTLRRIDEAHQKLERRGLARSIGTQESEYLAAPHFKVEMVERSRFFLLEKAHFVVFSEVDYLNHYIGNLFRRRSHLVLLSRHFPAARRNVARISGSAIRSACPRKGSACFSGAVNLYSRGTSGSRTIRSGLMTYSIAVTKGVPSREFSLNRACPRMLIS